MTALPTYPAPGLYIRDPATGETDEWDGVGWASDDWGFRDLSRLGDRDPLVPDLAGDSAVVSLIYSGKRHVFSGAPESAKTLLAYYQVLLVTRAGGKALIIDLEMDRYDARDLLRYLGATPKELRAISYINPESAPTTFDMQRLLDGAFDLVLIDAAAGAYSYSALDDNSRKDAETFARTWIDPFHRAGTATLVIDHVVKAANQRNGYAIGTERKVGQTDVHVGIETKVPLARGGHGIYKLHAHKDRPAGLRVPDCGNYLGELRIDSAPDTFALSLRYTRATSRDEGGGVFRPTTLMERVSRYVEANDGCSPTSVCRSVEGKDSGIATAIGVLVGEEYLVKAAGGKKGTFVLHSARPYHEADEADDDVYPPPPAALAGFVKD